MLCVHGDRRVLGQEAVGTVIKGRPDARDQPQTRAQMLIQQ